MKTYRYTDALGGHYDVPEHLLGEFERQRGVLLRIAITVKIIALAAVLGFAWYGAPVWIDGKDPHLAAVDATWAAVICIVVGSLFVFRTRPRIVTGIVLAVMIANIVWLLGR